MECPICGIARPHKVSNVGCRDALRFRVEELESLIAELQHGFGVPPTTANRYREALEKIDCVWDEKYIQDLVKIAHEALHPTD